MNGLTITLLAGAALLWTVLAYLGSRFARHDTRGSAGDENIPVGFFVWVMHVYARRVHRVRFEGLHHARAAGDALRAGRPLILTPNHTSGVDTVLIQAGLDFEPRWMMAADMRVPWAGGFWELGRIIFVDRDAPDAASLRTALRHLEGGGALGIFPEGHLERPPRHVLPFKQGVGLMIRRSRALVLPVVIEGTPQIDPAFASLVRTSRSVVRFLEPVDYAEDRSMKPAQIVADLRGRIASATGWPTTERAPIIGAGHRFLINVDGRYYEEATGEIVDDDDPRLDEARTAMRRRVGDADTPSGD